MKASAEVGDEAEVALVSGAVARRSGRSAEAGAHAVDLVRARSEPPGRDHLVADIFVDLAAGLGDSERHVGDETVEQIQNAQLADALGDRGRGAHVDEQQRALLDTRGW